MINIIKNYIIASILLVAIDSIYLKIISKFFNSQIKSIQGTNIKIDISAAILCYFILSFGLFYFIIIKNASLFDSFLLGVLVYGVYEATNKALFTNWKWETLLIDGIWGGILFLLTTFLYRKLV